MKVNIVNLEKKLNLSAKALDTLTSHTIYVGIRDPENAMKAFRNEFGCWNEKAQRMNPARPFMAKTFRGERQRVLKNIVSRQVKNTILSGRFTPNAEATVKRKHHSQVLVGKTGDMYNSIEGWVE